MIYEFLRKNIKISLIKLIIIMIIKKEQCIFISYTVLCFL